MKKVFGIYLLLISVLIVNLAVFATPKIAKAASASFYLSPASKQVTVGETVTASVMISTDSAINAGEGSVSFPADILEYQSVSTNGSIFTFWTSGPSGNASSVTFGGGLANPGYNGGGGRVLSISWKAKVAGTATINISGSRILANDGAGTNILSGSSGGTIVVSTATSGSTGEATGEATGQATGQTTSQPTSQTTSVSSSTHPDQNAWYNQKKITLLWSASGSQGYSFALDQSASTTPSAAPVSTKSKSYDIAGEGVWYFHIRAKFDSGFGPITHFKIQIDTTPPEEFAITINQEGGTSNPSPIVNFVAFDKLSGIARYEAVINGGQPFAINSGDKLPKQKPGDHKIVIRAIDKAGNVRESNGNYHIQGIAPPDVRGWTKIVGLLEGVTFSGFADPEDTIVIYLGDEEVVRFKAKDHKVSMANPLFNSGGVAFASAGDKIAWEYTVKKPLSPGVYYFRIGRIDKNGAESELSEPIKVSVVASTAKLFGHSVPTLYIIVPLIILVIALMVIILWLLKKIRKFARNKGVGFAPAWSRIKRIFSKTEKEIDHQIEEVIPSSNLSKGVISEVKKDLKEKVHETFQKEQEGLDKNEDPEDDMRKIKINDKG